MACCANCGCVSKRHMGRLTASDYITIYKYKVIYFGHGKDHKELIIFDTIAWCAACGDMLLSCYYDFMRVINIGVLF